MFKSKQKPQGASLQKPENKTNKRNRKILMSGIHWKTLLAGFVFGVMVTMICQVFIVHRPPEEGKINPTFDSSDRQSQMSLKKNVDKNKNSIHNAPVKKPVFDFYTELVEKNYHADSSVQVPAKNTAVQVINQSQKTAQIVSGKQKKSPDYFVQVASLRNKRSAIGLQKKLRLWGLNAQVKTVGGEHGRWFRVQLGPFLTQENAKDAQSILVLHSMKGFLIKQ